MSRRISIEIDAFLDNMGIDLGFCTSPSPSFFLSDAVGDADADGGGISLLSFSCSFLELVNDDFSLSLSRLRSLDELDEEDDDDDDEDFEDLCLVDDVVEDEDPPRSLSLPEELELELERTLSLSRCLSLELRWDDDDDEPFDEFLDEEDDDEEDLWLDDDDL